MPSVMQDRQPDTRACTVIWHAMRRRCSDARAHNFHKYGGRGIAVCKEWDQSYATFRAWALGNGYEQNLVIDRRNNDGPYSPYNCRWITPIQNANNTRLNVRISAFGETKTLSEWSRDPRCRATYQTLAYRIRAGWEPKRAITTSPRS